jgi:hypothetical protein
MLLGAIRDFGPFGRVFSVNINPPNDRFTEHSAAKLVFFQPGAANMLYRKGQRVSRLVVGGQHARVSRHRVKIEAFGKDDGRQSRVIRIQGPKDVVNQPHLHCCFNEKFYFETEYVRIVDETQTERTIEWAFASYYAQAPVAMLMFKRHFEETDPDRPQLLRYWFVHDPVDFQDCFLRPWIPASLVGTWGIVLGPCGFLLGPASLGFGACLLVAGALLLGCLVGIWCPSKGRRRRWKSTEIALVVKDRLGVTEGLEGYGWTQRRLDVMSPLSRTARRIAPSSRRTTGDGS